MGGRARSKGESILYLGLSVKHWAESRSLVEAGCSRVSMCWWEGGEDRPFFPVQEACRPHSPATRAIGL